MPSFLQLDYQGRVIRLETFSKTLAPGSRLGFSITNPIFTERLLRAAEVEVQAPNGWSQVIITGLMQTWGIRGYLTWLANLRDEYQLRRDEMVSASARGRYAMSQPPTYIVNHSPSVTLWPRALIFDRPRPWRSKVSSQRH